MSLVHPPVYLRDPMYFTSGEKSELRDLGAHLNFKQTAQFYGLTSPELEDLFASEPESRRAWQQGKGESIRLVSEALMAKIMSGDTAAMIFYLRTKAKWAPAAPTAPEGPQQQALPVFNVSLSS